MWYELTFAVVVFVASFFAWRWCKRRCNLDDSEEIEANAMTPPPAPRVPRKR